jgi:hypothetical protein
MNSSDRGTSTITASSSDPLPIRHPRSHRVHFRPHSFVALLALMVSSCATLRTAPHECRAGTTPRMSSVLFTTSHRFWFTNAVVRIGYHKTGIAPEEVLTGEGPTFLPMRLAVNIAADCKSSLDLREASNGISYPRIAGRGRSIEAEQVFEIDCICSVEPTAYTEDRGVFWDY